MRLGRGTAIYGGGMMLNRLLSILMLPLFTSYLSPAEYGVSAITATLVLLASGLFTLGTGNSMSICYFEAELTARSRVVWTTMALLALNTAAWTTAGLLGARGISHLLFGTTAHAYVVSLALGALAIQSVGDPVWSYLRIEDRARTFVALSVFSTLLTLASSVYLVVHLRRGIAGLFEAALIAKCVVLVMLLAVAARSLAGGVNWSLVRPLVRVGFPSIFGLGAFYIVDYADRVMLERMVGMGEVGIYAIGYSFGTMMNLFVDAFGSAWPAYFLSFVNRPEDASRTFGEILKIYTAGALFLCLCFFAAAKPAVYLLTNARFHGAYTVVGLVAVAYALKGAYLIMTPGIYFAKQLHWLPVVEWTAAGVTIALNLLLIPLLARNGAALATCLAYAALPVCAYFAARRYLAVEHDWFKIAALVVSFGIGAATIYAAAAIGSMPVAIASAAVVIGLYGYVALTIVFGSIAQSPLRALFAQPTAPRD